MRTTSGTAAGLRPRERLLNTAERLFYERGIHTVGVEQLVAEAGVTRATFYRHFAGKEGLVLACLRERDARMRRAVAAVRSAHRGRDALLGILDVVGEALARPGFRGCGFVNAAAEHPDPDHPVRRCVAEHREWFSGVLREVVREAGHRDPRRLARTLVLLRDGAMVSGHLDKEQDAAAALRRAALELLDAG